MFNWELSFNLGKAVGLVRLNSSAFCMYTFRGDFFKNIFDIFAYTALQDSYSYKTSEGIFSTSAIFKATSKLFGSQGCFDGKTDFIFPAFSSRFVDFAVQFCFRCKFSFHEERRWSQV